ncbi:VWA domain-containing protein [Leptospira sp. 96542]|nr:VWA domain-containing protein [Leptospira sp. 96542]
MLIFALFFLSYGANSDTQTNKRYVIILDASGSMTEILEGKTRMAVAKEKLTGVLGSLGKDVSVGLVAYGNRIPGCDSARLYQPIMRGAGKLVSQKINQIVPAGSTPIAQTLSVVGEFILSDQVETNIIFISDGVESCEGDPKAVLYALKTAGKKFQLHILGMGLDPKGDEDLKRLAVIGNGDYYSIKEPNDFTRPFQRLFLQSPSSSSQETLADHKPLARAGMIQILSVLPYEDGFVLNYEYNTDAPGDYMVQVYLFPKEEKNRSFPVPTLRERRMGDLIQHKIDLKSGQSGKGKLIFTGSSKKEQRVSAELWDLSSVPKIIALSEEKPVHLNP